MSPEPDFSNFHFFLWCPWPSEISVKTVIYASNRIGYGWLHLLLYQNEDAELVDAVDKHCQQLINY